MRSAYAAGKGCPQDPREDNLTYTKPSRRKGERQLVWQWWGPTARTQAPEAVTFRDRKVVLSKTRSSGSSRCPALLEAFAAVDRPTLGQLKGNGRFFSALRANRRGHSSGVTVAARRLASLSFAVLAPFGLVLKPLVGVKELLARGEYKVRPALHALEYPVSILHAPPLFASALPSAQKGPAQAARPPLAHRPLRLSAAQSRSSLAFFRSRFRASASLTRRLSPGFR